MPPDSPATCPKCRTPLPPSAPRGLCPACLMDAAGGETEVLPVPEGFGAPLDLDTLRRAFPQLEILAPLGAGGMGRVYKVRQPNLDRLAALKVLPPDFARDPAWVERFTREARALARLNHPNIVQVYDVGQTSGGPEAAPLCWLLMEFVDGVTLRQVQRTGGLSAREALALVPKLCDALQYAHEKGVLHRDIKPENILLDSAGTAKIADFGLAKLAGPHPSPTLTMTGARLGTAAYMAPEQIESPSDVDHRADIYSLGVVLYELLTGGLPLGRFPAPSEKSGTDPRLDHIVFRTLEKERERRYQAAGDVRSALETVAAPPQPRERRPADAPAGPAMETPRREAFHIPESVKQATRNVAQKAVRFFDRHKRFPASAAEATGYGCGLMFLFVLRLSLCFVPLAIPVLWLEGVKEWKGDGMREFYPASMIWVTAATGLVAWLCVQPFLAMTKLPERQWIARKAPILLLLAVVVWGVTLVLVASAARSWPTHGVAGRLTISSHRPPLEGGTAVSSDAALDGLFRGIVERELAGNTLAVLAGTGLTGIRHYHDGYYDDSHSRSQDFNKFSPLRKTWTLALAAESEQTLERRLLRIAEALLAALPPEVHDSVSVEWRRTAYPRDIWGLDLMDEEMLLGLAAMMMVGGWMAGMTRGRPLLHSMVPFILAAGAVALHLSPGGWIPGRGVIPLKDAESPPHLKGTAMETLTTMAATDPEAAAAKRWIDACRRLDRATAVELNNGQRLEDHVWEQSVGVWLNEELLAVAKSPPPPAGISTDSVFKFIVVPRRGASTSSYGWSRYAYNYYPSDAVKSRPVEVTVIKKGDTFRVQASY